MKLTQRSQGFRFRRPRWPAGMWFDVLRVGRSTVAVLDQNGKIVEFDRDELDIDWERMGGTTALKRDEHK